MAVTEDRRNSQSRASRIISVTPEQLYAAFMDPAALVEWMPPAEMTGKLHSFDGRIGGGYEMSLFYPPDEQAYRGKTSDREDRVKVRFVDLTPPHRIEEAVTFVSADSAFAGEMKMEVTFHAAPGGTEVVIACSNLPPGLKAEDNEEGSRLSLEQLAQRFE